MIDSVVELLIVCRTTADTTGRSKTLGQLGLEWSAIHSNIFGMGGCCDYHPEDIGLLHRALRPL